MKQKERRTIVEEHHHWGFNKLIKMLMILMISLIIVSSIIRITENKVLEDQIIYKQCTNSCSAKHFSGISIGADNTKLESARVNEFDRTECLNNCNELIKESLK